MKTETTVRVFDAQGKLIRTTVTVVTVDQVDEPATPGTGQYL